MPLKRADRSEDTVQMVLYRGSLPIRDPFQKEFILFKNPSISRKAQNPYTGNRGMDLYCADFAERLRAQIGKADHLQFSQKEENRHVE